MGTITRCLAKKKGLADLFLIYISQLRLNTLSDFCPEVCLEANKLFHLPCLRLYFISSKVF